MDRTPRGLVRMGGKAFQEEALPEQEPRVIEYVSLSRTALG